MKTNKDDKIFLGGAFICLIGVVAVIGIIVFIKTDFETTGGNARATEVEAENKTNVIDTAMNELKEMELLELIDLRKRVLDFKEFSSFNFDVSGILDIFK